MTERPTETENRKSNRPVKFTISASWFLNSSRNPKYSIKPVSAVPTASKKITNPINLCHGRSVALVEASAPGKK
ncbi:hypothetical protein TSUD_12480 [Trifolium subterraneum]|uniref:Uncharacterized protein n=1 Tax=Trifolium subterraneum TaxID=3900 RepID=A0A2Z6LTA3_TRISU|nr:hypothetical protein TSUD_12480 [Trifolium subterraneum]